jgi:hypothetical protein
MNDFYLGNKNLKRKDVKLGYTQEQIAEYLKCASDVDYFCETYVKIVSVDRGLIPFKPFEYQKTMFKVFDANRFSICKMPRQVGKTTGVVGYLLHKILFNENYNIAVLANKQQQAREILSRVQLAYEWLPKWLQQGIVEWNKGNIELENGSKILASSTSSSAIRGQSYNLIYLDEFAFVPRNIQDSFFASVFPTISSGQSSKLIITSTPNGMNMFYKIWMDSLNDLNSYARLDVHWSDVPGRDEAWKEETIRNTSVDQFRQEFESCAYETIINTDNGHFAIGKLYDILYNTEVPETLVLNDKYRINSPEGFVNFFGINKIVKDRYIHLQFSNGKDLKCSEDHPISTINGIVKAKNLDKKTEIYTRYKTGCFVTSKSLIKNEIDLYDIVNCGTQHLYYTNDIVSHNCEFLGSTNTLIHPAILSKLVYVRPLEQPHDVKIYKHPIKDHIYAMTVDVSEGLGLDSSTLVVVDCTTVPYEVVATFADANISQLMFPTLLANIGKYYNEASILVEINIGSQVVNILHQDLEYENIVMTKMSGRKGTIIGSAGNQNRLGIKTTKITKRIGCANLKTLVESNKIILNDFNIINELSTYVVDGTSYNAEDGHHDDLVMCLVLFAWMVSQNYFKDVSNTDIRRRIAEEIEDDFTPFGMIDDGREDEFDGFVSNDQFEKFLLS